MCSSEICIWNKYDYHECCIGNGKKFHEAKPSEIYPFSIQQHFTDTSEKVVIRHNFIG